MSEILYRPQHKSEKELTEDFVVRQLMFQKLMDSIKGDQPGKTPQHIILQGQRGMGKTTLMYMVYYNVLKTLRKKGIVPVIFNEEQYAIRTLYKLWEQTARFLEDNAPEYAGLWYKMQDLQSDKEYEDKCFELLKNAVQKNKHRLLLLIDNFGVMLDKFSKQDQQRFREILTTFPAIKIIGGSAVVLESFYKYDMPFFDFFKIMHLEKLDSDEVKNLLLRLGEKHNTDQVKEIIQNQPGRIETMRILTGGVPRTIVMLFEIFLDSDHGNSITDLKKLLEQVTPLYKHRMDELPPQQQEIVDKLALNWDGMSVSEIAQKTRMDSNAVSAQLSNLVKSGVVSTEKSTGKNKYYQVEERFFNIWYLMNHAPHSAQQKVIWLTRFLEYWCPGKYMHENASGFIQRLKSEKLHPEYIQAMTFAYSRVDGLSNELRDEIIDTAKNALCDLKIDTGELPVRFKDFSTGLKKLFEEEKFAEAITLIDKSSLPDGISNYLLGLIFLNIQKPKLAEQHLKKAVEKGDPDAMYNLALLYDDEYKDFKKAEKYYIMAVEKKHGKAMSNLALLYQVEFKDFKKAEKYYMMAVEKENVNAIYNLALLYHKELKDFKKAEKYYIMAVEKEHINAMYNLALLCEIELKDFKKAEKYYIMAVKKEHVSAMYNLALLYENEFKDFKKAEKYYTMAVEKEHVRAMYNLALLYENEFKDYKKVEKYYLMAINKGDVWAINNMLNLVIEHNIEKYSTQTNSWIEKLIEAKVDGRSKLYKVRFNLWANEPEEATAYLEKIMPEVLKTDEWDFIFSDLLAFAIAKGLRKYVYKLFQQPQYQLKDRFKVVYYALMRLLENEYPNEIKKMGKELEEPVAEMVKYIKELEKKYQ